MSSADIWSKAPESIRSPAAASPQIQTASTEAGKASHPTKDWPSLVKSPLTAEDTSYHGKARNKQPRYSKGQNNNLTQGSLIGVDHAESGTTSTQSLTNTQRSATAQRLNELELEMKKCRSLLQDSSRTAEETATRLDRTEQHLTSTMEMVSDLTRNVTTIQSQMCLFSQALENIRLSILDLSTRSLKMVPTQSLPLDKPVVEADSAGTEMNSSLIRPNSDVPPSPSRTSPVKKRTKQTEHSDALDCSMELLDDLGNGDDSLTSNNSEHFEHHHHNLQGPPDARNDSNRDLAGPLPE